VEEEGKLRGKGERETGWGGVGWGGVGRGWEGGVVTPSPHSAKIYSCYIFISLIIYFISPYLFFFKKVKIGYLENTIFI
jgi:hypothetical protein